MMDKDGDKVRNSQPLVIILPNSIHNHFPTVAYHATQIEPDWARYRILKSTKKLPYITVYDQALPLKRVDQIDIQ